MTREEAAARNRAQFPSVAAFVDAMRESFGPGIRLVYASENGNTLGTADLPGVTVVPVLEHVPEQK